MASKKAKTSTEKTLRVRIKPSSPREQHIDVATGISIKKSDGWCDVERGAALQLAEIPLHELNPDSSPRVFDVCTAEEALQIEDDETEKIDPSGTAGAPKVKRAAAFSDERVERGSPREQRQNRRA